ncbi:MAG: hypothetical protein K9N55_00565 [Phycisphaerae bacterium]|nr:hypothetical protein [Phycisphaerae bacterium]
MTLDGLICNMMQGLILALTPSERWQAARAPAPGQLTNRWFILGCVIVLVVLTALLFWVSLHRIRQEHQMSDQRLIDMAQEKALTVRECQILKAIGKFSGLRRLQSVHSNRVAFERGAAKMIGQTLSDKGPREKEQLAAEVSLLREKMGFGRAYAAMGTTQSRSSSSRKIPVAKSVTLLPVPAGNAKPIEAMIHGNTDYELSLQLTNSIKVTFGGLWTVRYFLGASVWEFDTSVISYDGTILVLTHSDHIRFVNRRRFVRASVIRRALVAKFPFEQTLEWTEPAIKARSRGKKVVPIHPIDQYGAPEFISATVTELGGPGLRIETLLEAKIGERVLVVFDLDLEPLASDDPTVRHTKTRLIEDIGEVRHVRHLEKGVSMAVELCGLKDADVNELIRATNAALININETKTTSQVKESHMVTQEVSA